MIILGLLLWGWAEMSAFIFIGGEIGGLLTLLGVFMTAVWNCVAKTSGDVSFKPYPE
jgi:UPF0716 family protein affecting phage T7 exclusion